jgi:hypothetical protein
MELRDATTSRRDFLRTLCGFSCVGVLGSEPSVAQTPLSRGCWLTSEGMERYRAQGHSLHALADGAFTRNGHFRKSGNPDIDVELDKAVKVAAEILDVNPAFGFFDPDKFASNEREGMNAFAYHRNAEKLPGTRGIVGFGLGRFRTELYGHDESGTTVMAIIAHEFGHVLQNDRGYRLAITTLQCEINADFLSGYYLACRKLRVPSVAFERAAVLFERLGRAGNGDPNRSHGDSRERVAAAEAGFRAGYDQRMSLTEAVMAGWDYIGYRPA